jgi:hypothetical protein
MKYGKWTVIDKNPPGRLRDRDRDRNIYWQVRCDCGTEKLIRSADLISGRSKSCGKCPRMDGGGRKQIGVCLPIGIYLDVVETAMKAGISKSKMVRRMIEDYLGRSDD